MLRMIELRLLARLNEVLTLGKRAPPEASFGGIHVVLLSDYIQYIPVLDKPLYKNLDRGTSIHSAAEMDVQYRVGLSLVLRINPMIKLTKQMRTEDEKYLTLLDNLRSCETTHANFS